MARKTLYVPDDLAQQLGELDDANLSREFQEFLRLRLSRGRRRPPRPGVEPTVRALAAADIPHVVQLWHEGCVASCGEGLTQTSRRGVRRVLERTLDEPRALCLIGEIDEAFAGFVTASVVGHPVEGGWLGEVEELFVHPEARGLALEPVLLDAALTWLHAQDVNSVQYLCAVEERDSELVRLVRARGFEEHRYVLNWYAS